MVVKLREDHLTDLHLTCEQYLGYLGILAESLSKSKTKKKY